MSIYLVFFAALCVSFVLPFAGNIKATGDGALSSSIACAVESFFGALDPHSTQESCVLLMADTMEELWVMTKNNVFFTWPMYVVASVLAIAGASVLSMPEQERLMNTLLGILILVCANYLAPKMWRKISCLPTLWGTGYLELEAQLDALYDRIESKTGIKEDGLPIVLTAPLNACVFSVLFFARPLAYWLVLSSIILMIGVALHFLDPSMRLALLLLPDMPGFYLPF